MGQFIPLFTISLWLVTHFWISIPQEECLREELLCLIVVSSTYSPPQLFESPPHGITKDSHLASTLYNAGTSGEDYQFVLYV